MAGVTFTTDETELRPARKARRDGQTLAIALFHGGAVENACLRALEILVSSRVTRVFPGSRDAAYRKGKAAP